jgi:hypothetical protein
LLLSQLAHDILLIIWKESGFFSDDILATYGIEREFSRTKLNSYNMATTLTSDPKAVAAFNSRIATIATAAEAFLLIEKNIDRAKLRPLQGTPLLHSFMVKLSARRAPLLIKLVDILTPPGAGADNPVQ